jgi:hypothetical protein
MKNKILYFGLGALAFVAASCSSDEFESVSSSTLKDGLITVTVEGNSSNTRVGFTPSSTDDTKAEFYWSKDDEIGVTVVNNGTEASTFTAFALQSGAGTQTGVFSTVGEVASGASLGQYVVYPYYKSDESDSPKQHEITTTDGATTLKYYFRPTPTLGSTRTSMPTKIWTRCRATTCLCLVSSSTDRPA